MIRFDQKCTKYHVMIFTWSLINCIYKASISICTFHTRVLLIDIFIASILYMCIRPHSFCTCVSDPIPFVHVYQTPHCPPIFCYNGHIYSSTVALFVIWIWCVFGLTLSCFTTRPQTHRHRHRLVYFIVIVQQLYNIHTIFLESVCSFLSLHTQKHCLKLSNYLKLIILLKLLMCTIWTRPSYSVGQSLTVIMLRSILHH